MKRLKNGFAIILLSVFVLLSNSSAFAGKWKQDTIGWWYLNDNSTYPKGTWK